MDETIEQRIAKLEQLLEDIQEVVEENNELLIAMKRSSRRAFWGKLLLWVLVLGLPFLLIGPILHTLIPALPSDGAHQSLFGLPSPEQIQALLETYKQASTTP